MDYHVIRSKRKTVSLEIGKDGIPLVRAPLRMAKIDIEHFVQSHISWIEKHRALWEKRQADEPSEEEIEKLVKQAKAELPALVEHYSKMMGLKPEGVKVTKAKTRFGSCSGKNRICFSCFLMRYPKEAVEYVVVHELAHIRYHHHQKEFYQLVSHYMPDYKERIKLLKG